MSYRYEIRLSGSGGQGLILMGIILAEAVGIYDGKFVAQTQSYGPEAGEVRARRKSWSAMKRSIIPRR
jgi:Pyruvate/2-oxoacid:ferredoxin oxidoreductase gamma subunit